MEPITIGMMLMAAAAGMNAKAANDANRKQQAEIRASQARQGALQDQATAKAKAHAQEYDPGERKNRNDQIAQDLTAGYEKEIAAPMVTAQGVQIGSTLPEGEGGGDYLKTRAREAAKTTESLRALAALMGRTGAASELRRGEAVRFGDTANDIAGVGRHAGNIWGADQAGISAAGNPSLGLQLGAAALNAYGMSNVMGAGLNGGSAVGAPAGGGGVGLQASPGQGSWLAAPANDGALRFGNTQGLKASWR